MPLARAGPRFTQGPARGSRRGRPSYPVLTLAVNVSSAPLLSYFFEHVVSVAGGGDNTPFNNGATDVTYVNCTFGPPLHECTAVTSTSSEATTVGLPTGVIVTTTMYVGPQAIRVGDLGFCAAASPPAGCTGGALVNIIAGFINYDILTLTVIAPAATLDIDGSDTATKYDALTDGLLAIRYLFGLTGTSLTGGALGGTATRTDPAVIKTYLDANRSVFDIDGDGNTDALTDGLLILRYLFGLRGASLIHGAFVPGAPRNTAALIEAYLGALTP